MTMGERVVPMGRIGSDKMLKVIGQDSTVSHNSSGDVQRTP